MEKIKNMIDLGDFYKAFDEINENNYDGASEFWNSGTEKLIGLFQKLGEK